MAVATIELYNAPKAFESRRLLILILLSGKDGEATVPVEVMTVFKRGGRELIDLLEFCVLSVNKDSLFLFLTQEYQQRPTADAAVALYAMFCAAGSPATISPSGLLPPKDMRLENAIAPFRNNLLIRQQQLGADHADADGDPPECTPPLLPPRYLFDVLVPPITHGEETAIARLGRSYDPALTPHANLPGGRVSEGQRAFVEHIWSPIVRPTLVSAGFWRIATVA
jgi:hypothetical protein